MKIIFFTLFIFNNSFLLLAQTSNFKTIRNKPSRVIKKPVKVDPCTNFIKIAELASAVKLNTLITLCKFKSKYYTNLFEENLSIPSIKIVGAKENYIEESELSGTSYNCFLRECGTDSIIANTEFEKLVENYSDCAKINKIDRSHKSLISMYYKKCHIFMSVYLSDTTHNWVIYMRIESEINEYKFKS